MRTPLIAGNWKMNLTHLEALRLVQGIGHELADHDPRRVEVVVCPPFTALRTVQTVIDSDRYELGLGAQNAYPAIEGAFTGEISPRMLKALDVSYVVLGHSERRELMGESDDDVNAKARLVLETGLTPIVCCGETESEHESGATPAKVERQIGAAFRGVRADAAATCVVAYEPIWAIGTGRTATPDDAQATIAHIRSVLRGHYGAEVPAGMRILYGGSVQSGNAGALTAKPDIDGALVGGASLEAAEFCAIVKAVE